MKNAATVLYKDIPAVAVTKKIANTTNWKRAKSNRFSFVKDCGDVPTVCHNPITGVFEDVVNPCGNAYARRNQLHFANKKRCQMKSYVVSGVVALFILATAIFSLESGEIAMATVLFALAAVSALLAVLAYSEGV